SRHQPDRVLAGAALLREAPRPLGEVPAVRVPELAPDADLLRADLGRPEQLRPELLLLGLRSRVQAGAPVAAAVPTPDHPSHVPLARTPGRVRRPCPAGPTQQRPPTGLPAALLAVRRLVALGAPLGERGRAHGRRPDPARADLDRARAEALLPRRLGGLRHQE